jgi:hypothetical protein
MTLHVNTKASHTMPAAARALGVAGLIPFVGLALLVAFSPEIKGEAATGLLIYGAVILSFLGGIRWGFAVIEGDQAGWSGYGLSVVPSLFAWVAALWGGPAGLLLLALSLAAWFGYEYSAPPAITLPAWYMRLRGLLTAIAVLSLAFAAFSW